MRKSIFAIVAIIILGAFILEKRINTIKTGSVKTSYPTSEVIKTPTGQAKTANIVAKRSIFVPYWSLTNLNGLSSYNRIIYFGLTSTTDGINTQDQGYTALGKLFKEIPSGKDVYVTLLFHDSDTTKLILEDQKVQRKVINDTINIVNQYKLRGVVLDVEINNIVDIAAKDKISNFVQLFYTSLKTNNSVLLLTLYGDLFYRKRPYDVSALAKYSDEIMVMAYDFHKAGGEPGPNFPLSGRDNYGYDFQEMVGDFLQFVPPQKLSVIFGMFGYEWEVDAKRRPLKPAKALSYLDIKKQFLDSCTWKDCLARRDDQSAETEIDYVTDYTDPDPLTNPDHLITPLSHVIWFEDQESVNKKIEYLKSNAIGSVAYWVWGYF